MKKILALILSTLLLVGCGVNNDNSDTEPITGEQQKAAVIDIPDIASGAEARSGSAEVEGDAIITLSDSGCAFSGEGVTVDGNVVTITEAGTYVVSGVISDGQLRVDTQSSEKVKLILNGVDLTCSDGPAIYILNAQKKVVLELSKDSVNLVEDGETYSDTSEDAPSATIFSKEDLDIDGEGTLFVTGNFGKGIFTKDDLSIEGGTIIVSAVDDGIRGKDSVEMSGGTVTITAGGDGLRTSNETDDGKGYINLSGGELYITSGQDGIQAVTDCTILGVTLTISSGGGSINSSTSNEDWGQWGGGAKGNHSRDDGFGKQGEKFYPSQGEAVPSVPAQDGAVPSVPSVPAQDGDIVPSVPAQDGDIVPSVPAQDGDIVPSVPAQDELSTSMTITQTEETLSAKGIKAAGRLVIAGGKISIDSSDDALHSNDTVTISGGELYISSGDDGIHADSELNISAGVVTVEKSYEGIEALTITISGGDISVVATDDGINGAGGNDGSSLANRPGRNSFASDASGLVTITGGNIILNASGDGLDSNGNIVQSGGSIIVYGPTSSGNGALDYAGTYTLSGGSVLAVGAAGMAQKVNDCDFGQVYSMVRADAGSTVEIADANGTILVSVTLPKAIESVVFAASTVSNGDECTISVDGVLQ